jgi:hypothetical protein
MKSIIIIAIVFCTACANKKKMATTKTSEQPQAATQTNTNQADSIAQQFKVRIIRVSCASLVAVILDDDKLDKGERWAPYNVRMAQPYKGAFTISNLCDFKNPKEGDTFMAGVIKPSNKTATPCTVCTLADYPPSTTYTIKVLGEVKNEF